MKPTIFLLTGWGVGIAPLQNLAKRLVHLDYRVILSNLPYQENPQQWLPSLASRLPIKSYWLGWSLGGQLLSQLTQDCGEKCLGLMTLASNPCFKVRADWQTAMTRDIFENFQLTYKDFPERTIKRFLQLVAQGCSEPRQIVKQLQQNLTLHSIEETVAGLELLASLDTRQVLQQYQGKQYHLLAEFDALVPKESVDSISNLLPKAKVELLPETGHAFPVQADELTAMKIDQFIKEEV